MEIKYIPERLGSLLDSPYANKRLKNRDAIATAVDNQGNQLSWQAEGNFIEVNGKAVDFAKSNPDAQITILENSCGSTSY